MDVILSAISCKYARVYLDDILIYSRVPNEHIKQTEEILWLLKDVSIALKL